MYVLPKEYLSVSQINLWKSDPGKYMKKYFMGMDEPSSIQMDFGKQFAKDIEDWSKGENRDFNFPLNFQKNTKLYELVEHRIEYEFENYKFLGFADNLSADYKILVDFKTGTVPWTQKRLDNSLQMMAYSAMIYLQQNVIPKCVINYYGTKLISNKIHFDERHEIFSKVFSYDELVQTSEHIDEVAKEISDSFSIYKNENISKLMEEYADILQAEKVNLTQKERVKKIIEKTLNDNRYIKQIRNKVISYSTYDKKSYTYSATINDSENTLDQQKKKEVEYGIAECSTKKITLISLRTLKDEGI